MSNTFPRIIKQTVSITAPRIWFYSAGLYLLGVSLALAFTQNPPAIPSWWFALCLLWIILVGMIAGLSHAEESSNFVFPSELILKLCTYLVTGRRPQLRKHTDRNVDISIAISGSALVLFLLVCVLFLNSKIFILGISLLVVDYAYNSRHFLGKNRPYVDVLSGAVHSIPLFIGYVFITNEWPPAWLMLAGVLYLTAAELHHRILVVKNDYAKNIKTSATTLGEEGSFLMSIVLVILCGIIFAFYNVYYFLFVIPFLIILLRSLFTENPDDLHQLYSRAFLVHSITGFLAVSYFFILQATSKLP